MASVCFDLAIIGCGAVSVSLLHQLKLAFDKNKPRDNYTISVFESSAKLGSGYAYSVASDELLLNSRRDEMGISPDHPESFKLCLQQRGVGEEAGAFVCRRQFSAYIASEMASLIASDAYEITIISQPVTHFIAKEGHTSIAHEGGLVTATHTVIAHGGYPLSPYPDYSHHVVRNMYQPASIADIPDNSRVLILGSSLSMADACLLLREQHCCENDSRDPNKNYAIEIASTNGYFPALKHAVIDKPYGQKISAKCGEFFETNAVNAHSLIAFIDEVLSDYYQCSVSITELQTCYELSVEELGGSRIHQSYDPYNLSPIAPYLDDCVNWVWPELSERDRTRLSPLVRYLLRFICGIPEVNMLKIRQFLNEPEKQIKRITNLTYSGNHYTAHFRDRSEKEFDYVIDCAGIAGYYSPSNPQALAKNIRSQGQLQLTKKYGLAINERCQTLSTTGSVNSQLFAVGIVTDGANFIRHDFSFYSGHAAKVVDEITRQMNHS